MCNKREHGCLFDRITHFIDDSGDVQAHQHCSCGQDLNGNGVERVALGFERRGYRPMTDEEVTLWRTKRQEAAAARKRAEAEEMEQSAEPVASVMSGSPTDRLRELFRYPVSSRGR